MATALLTQVAEGCDPLEAGMQAHATEGCNSPDQCCQTGHWLMHPKGVRSDFQLGQVSNEDVGRRSVAPSGMGSGNQLSMSHSGSDGCRIDHPASRPDTSGSGRRLSEPDLCEALCDAPHKDSRKSGEIVCKLLTSNQN